MYGEQCLEVTTPCPYKCGDRTVLRKKMEQHKQTCPHRPMQCPCRHAGCKFEGTQNEIRNHCDKEEMEALRKELKKVRDKMKELESKLQNLQKTQDCHESRLGEMETNSINTSLSINDDSGQESLFGARLTELDLRVQNLEGAKHEGILIWKIHNYRKRKHDALTGQRLSLYSQPFFTGRNGYKICCCLYLNGRWKGIGTHLSLFLVIMKGENDAWLPWPFKQNVTFTLLDAEGGGRHHTDSFKPDPSSASFKRPEKEMNVACGLPLFVEHSVVECDRYLRDDGILIKVVVEPKDSLPGPSRFWTF